MIRKQPNNPKIIGCILRSEIEALLVLEIPPTDVSFDELDSLYSSARPITPHLYITKPRRLKLKAPLMFKVNQFFASVSPHRSCVGPFVLRGRHEQPQAQ